MNMNVNPSSNITQLLNQEKARQQYKRQLSQYLTPKEAAFKEVYKDLQQQNEIHNAHSFWYNPATDYRLVERDPISGNRPKLQSIYFGESYDRTRPTWDIQALDYGRYSSYIKSADASTDRQATAFDNLIGVFGNEIQEDAYNYLKALEADVMTSGDFANVQLLTTFIDVLDVQQRLFTLVNAVTTKATNVLNLQTASYDRFQITEDIGELEAPEGRKGRFNTQTFKLGKSGGSIAWSDEFIMQNWTINPYDYASQNVSSDIIRIKAKKIAAALATLATATTTGGDLAAFSGEHAANRPLLILSGIRSEIYANYGNPDTIVTNDKTYNTYLSNPDITPYTQYPAQTLSQTQPAGSVPAPGLTGVQWFIDQSVATGTLYYFNKNAVWLIQGPERTSNYRDEQKSSGGIVFRSWFSSVVNQAGFGKKITGLAT